MKSLYYRIKLFFSDIFNVITSLIVLIISLLFFRNKGISYRNCDKGSCCVLGNGPSLKSVLKNDIESLSNQDVFVVNGFASGAFFFTLRPKHYVVVDPNAFLSPISDYFVKFQEDILNAFSRLDWDLFFYAPAQQKRSYFIKRIKSLNNSHIKIVYINTIPADGPSWFRNMVYKTGWAMPKTWNILNAVICLTLNLGYKKVTLYGADHSWIRDIFVNEKNQLCQSNTHFHGANDYYVMEKGSLEGGLLSFAMCLRSYRYLNDYATSIGAIIVNKTKGSYLDVFEFEV